MFNSLDPVGLFSDWETLEMKEPSPRKETDKGVIYQSRPLVVSRDLKTMGQCMLTDFGNARMGSKVYEGLIQPEIYRSPESILFMPWGASTDIWNLGVMIWDVFRGDYVHLFHPIGDNLKLERARMLGEMVSLLGPPPKEFLAGSNEASAYWDKEGDIFSIPSSMTCRVANIPRALGNWKGLGKILPDYRFEQLEHWLKDDEQRQFLSFIRRMLVWEPAKRATAAELLKDKWLAVG
jgi:serine/threonine-protein kinase SRPK3